MFKERAITAGLVLLLCLPPSAVMAEDFQCPDHVVAQTVMEPLEAGSPWEIRAGENGGFRTLAGITIFDGTPEEMASLAPDTQDGQSVWTFAAQKQRKIWLECNYNNTPLKLARALPDTVTRCVSAASGKLSCE